MKGRVCSVVHCVFLMGFNGVVFTTIGLCKWYDLLMSFCSVCRTFADRYREGDTDCYT